MPDMERDWSPVNKIPHATIGGRTQQFEEAANCNAQQASRPMTTAEQIERIFTYHAPRPDQLPKYDAIRAAARYFAEIIVKNTPYGADQTAAIRKLRECVMTANGAVALDGFTL